MNRIRHRRLREIIPARLMLVDHERGDLGRRISRRSPRMRRTRSLAGLYAVNRITVRRILLHTQQTVMKAAKPAALTGTIPPITRTAIGRRVRDTHTGHKHRRGDTTSQHRAAELTPQTTHRPACFRNCSHSFLLEDQGLLMTATSLSEMTVNTKKKTIKNVIGREGS